MDDNTEHARNAPSPRYEQFGKLIDVNLEHSSNAKLLTDEHNGKSIFVK